MRGRRCRPMGFEGRCLVPIAALPWRVATTVAPRGVAYDYSLRAFDAVQVQFQSLPGEVLHDPQIPQNTPKY